MSTSIPFLKRLFFIPSLRQRLHTHAELKNIHLKQSSLNSKKITRKSIADSRFIVLDTETTGLQAYAGDEIISIAMLEYQGLDATGQIYEQYINPQREIPAKATAIHGITNSDVDNAPTLKKCLPDIMSFIDDAIIVGHHIQFDFRFLNKTLKPYLGIQLKNPWLDTMLLYLAHQGRLGHYSLEDVAAACHIQIRNRHTALGDAQATADIFRYLSGQLCTRSDPVINLINQQHS